MKILKHILYSSLAFSIIAGLCGCTAMNADFECHTHPGVKCKSIDEINTMVDEGTLGNSPKENLFPYFSSAVTLNNTITPHQVIRVWNAPFKERSGVYHAPTYVFFEV